MRAHWMDDWNRLNSSTDTDADGLPDFWEVENGLNRTNPYSSTGVHGEEGDDSDRDGLSHLDEFKYSGNPHSNDTDGDCLSDSFEITLALELSQGGSQTVIDESIREAMTETDIDKNGVNDGIQWNCGADAAPDSDIDGVEDQYDDCPDTTIGSPVDGDGCSSEQRSIDDHDDDGVLNDVDNCPNTPASEIAIGAGGPVADESYRGCSPSQLDEDDDGILDDFDDCLETPDDESVNINGCSAEQLAELAKSNSNDDEKGIAGTVFTVVMITSGILLGGWLFLNLLQKKGENDVLNKAMMLEQEIVDIEQLSMPVLDASAGMPVLDGSTAVEASTTPPEASIDMSLFPGWTMETVQTYIDQGWTQEQLKEWYDNSSN